LGSGRADVYYAAPFEAGRLGIRRGAWNRPLLVRGWRWSHPGALTLFQAGVEETADELTLEEQKEHQQGADHDERGGGQQGPAGANFAQLE